MAHSIENQTRAVRQALQPGKMPVGVMLGAGCPLSIRDEEGQPLIPDVAGLTAAVSKDISEEEQALKEHLERVHEHLLQDGGDPQNVEEVLSHIRVLKLAAGSDQARGLSGDALEKLDAAICKGIVHLVRRELPSTKTPYHRLARWAGGVQRSRALEIFTTNYDLLMEQALEEVGVPYFDGFAGSRKPFFDASGLERPSLSGPTEGALDELPSRWARLWKLHGSINWYQDADGVVFRGTVDSEAHTRLIYPSHLKYSQSQRMPYLAIFDRFAAFLRQSPCVLITCGYSFSDEHVNAVIEDGLHANPSAVCFALLFESLDTYGEARAMADRRSNLNLLTSDRAVVSGREAAWAAKLAPESDADDTTSAPRSDLGDFDALGRLFEGVLGTEPYSVRQSDER